MLKFQVYLLINLFTFKWYTKHTYMNWKTSYWYELKRGFFFFFRNFNMHEERSL